MSGYALEREWSTFKLQLTKKAIIDIEKIHFIDNGKKHIIDKQYVQLDRFGLFNITRS